MKQYLSYFLAFFTLILVSSNTFAERFSINLPLGRYLGPNAKRIEFTKEESEINRFCREKGFSNYLEIGKNDHEFYVDCTSPKNSPTHIRQISEGLLVAGPYKDSVYFVLEKVDSSNVAEWFKYVEKQDEALSNLKFDLKLLSRSKNNQQEKSLEDLKYEKYKDLISSSGDPILLFRKCLTYHDRAEVFVAYVVGEEPSKKFDREISDHVEMAFAVLTSKDAPFQLHMGIARGLEHLSGHISSDKKMTPNLAIKLHAFAAKAMRQIDPSKRYLITTPLKSMGDLIKKALPETAYQIGKNAPNSQIQVTAGSRTDDKEWSFGLRDKQGNVEFTANHIDANGKYRWFFDNTQPSSDHPYYVVNLQILGDNF